MGFLKSGLEWEEEICSNENSVRISKAKSKKNGEKTFENLVQIFSLKMYFIEFFFKRFSGIKKVGLRFFEQKDNKIKF